MESLSTVELAAWEADLWWLSPPCQPYTQRGLQRDLHDSRAASLLALVRHVSKVRPAYLAMENIPGFVESRSRQIVLDVLRHCRYQVSEQLRCPTELGIANRRRRYYLLASRDGNLASHVSVPSVISRRVIDVVSPEYDLNLQVARKVLEKYARTLHVVAADDPQGITNCFTSAYGRSINRSGSYLRTHCGVRRFSPSEIVRWLGFPAWYQLPDDMTVESLWRLTGNSLAVDVVRGLLDGITTCSGGRHV